MIELFYILFFQNDFWLYFCYLTQTNHWSWLLYYFLLVMLLFFTFKPPIIIFIIFFYLFSRNFSLSIFIQNFILFVKSFTILILAIITTSIQWLTFSSFFSFISLSVSLLPCLSVSLLIKFLGNYQLIKIFYFIL